MVNSTYAKAYAEVIEILKYISKEDYEKIPHEKIEFYQNNMDKEYEYKIDETIEFEEQKISDITRAILANMFRDYWATEYQQIRILAKEKQDLETREQEKREQYPTDNIFKSNDIQDVNEDSNTALVPYKSETWYTKVISYVKNIFRKNSEV